MIPFAFGLVLGVIPGVIWGRLGGDEEFGRRWPWLGRFLHLIHHAEVGIVLMAAGAVFDLEFLLGFGAGLALDDLLFHSFEVYFSRRV